MKKDFKFDYNFFITAADYVRGIVPWQPEIAIILGSALGELADMIDDPVVIPYEDIPNFLISTVKSHAGKLIFGTIGGRRVVCMSGRFHYYEGYDFEQLVIPIRLFHLLGARVTILTNAAGAVNTDYRPGDVMIIRDHIKLTSGSPLRGANIEEFGERFFDMTQVYPPALRQIAKKCGEASLIRFHEGVYMFFAGPQFETPAEIRAARILGADAIGMSTVAEAITAAHCGMPLLALSVMTNMAAGVIPDMPVTGEEVDAVGEMVSNALTAYVKELIVRIGEEYINDATD